MANLEIVQRIKDYYVGNDCAQVMIPYNKSITLLSPEEIMYHDYKNTKLPINKYINSKSRDSFPYSNIPTHYQRVLLFKKMNYTNQILKLNTPYFSFSKDTNIIERYVVKDNTEALLVSKICFASDYEEKYFSREEMDNFFSKPSNSKDSIYILSADGGIYKSINSIDKHYDFFDYSNENILKYYKDEIERKINYYQMCNPSSEQNIVEYSLNSTKKSLESMTINNVPAFDIDNGWNTILVKVTDGIFTIQAITVRFINKDTFKIGISNIPVSKYSLEQIKRITSKIHNTKEPRFPKGLNSNISNEDLEKARQLIKKR